MRAHVQPAHLAGVGVADAERILDRPALAGRALDLRGVGGQILRQHRGEVGRRVAQHRFARDADQRFDAIAGEGRDEPSVRASHVLEDEARQAVGDVEHAAALGLRGLFGGARDAGQALGLGRALGHALFELGVEFAQRPVRLALRVGGERARRGVGQGAGEEALLLGPLPRRPGVLAADDPGHLAAMADRHVEHRTDAQRTQVAVAEL